MAKEDDDFDAVVREFVTTQMTTPVVTEWVDRIMTAILDGLPNIASDAYLTESIRRSAESQWTAFLTSLTEPEQTVPMIPSAAQMAVELAQRGHSLKELFRVYRLARRGVWEYVKDVLFERIESGVGPALPIFVWDRVSHWIDEVVEASGTLFENERDQVREGAAAQRLGTVREVLAGNWGADERELSAALGGHPVSGYNTALVLSSSNIDNARGLNAAAIELARATGVRNPLVVSPGGRDLWMWLSTTKPPAIDRLVATEPASSAPGIQVVIGSPGRGIDGFRQSHLEAQQAQQIAAVAKSPSNPLYFPDVETLVMLWQSGEQAVRFAQRTLGDLSADLEPMSRLRQTARATLRAGSLEKAADVLMVHKNTVRYRLGQIEKILGRGLSDDPVPLALALDYHEAFLENGTPPGSPPDTQH